MTGAGPAPFVPHYGGGGLGSVLPTVAAGLGAGWAAPEGPSERHLAPARRSVVVLIDGLGYELVRRRGGHAPFLRGLLPSAHRLAAGFPSTTATSMATFGTGRDPGEHGLVGYEVLDPDRDQVLNQLSWADGPDPLRWQQHDTVFQRAERAGIAVTRIGLPHFDGSGLTQAALRGGRFVAAKTLADSVDAALAALRADARALVYLYWGAVDKVGHVHGCSSWEWGEELTATDAEMRRLVASVPSDTSVHLTADHGMVDAPHALRIDLAHDAEMASGIRHLAGEARAPQLHVQAGALADVRATWAQRLHDRAWVLSRDEAIEQGWFGTVEDVNRARIGDLVIAMWDSFAVVDSRTQRPQMLALLGHHGSLTEDEVAVPWFVAPARDQRIG